MIAFTCKLPMIKHDFARVHPRRPLRARRAHSHISQVIPAQTPWWASQSPDFRVDLDGGCCSCSHLCASPPAPGSNSVPLKVELGVDPPGPAGNHASWSANARRFSRSTTHRSMQQIIGRLSPTPRIPRKPAGKSLLFSPLVSPIRRQATT